MLELQNMKKQFGAVTALNGASMTVKEGEIVALLGANGSGKSTLVKTLGGLVRPNEGEILIDGKK